MAPCSTNNKDKNMFLKMLVILLKKVIGKVKNKINKQKWSAI